MGIFSADKKITNQQTVLNNTLGADNGAMIGGDGPLSSGDGTLNSSQLSGTSTLGSTNLSTGDKGTLQNSVRVSNDSYTTVSDQGAIDAATQISLAAISRTIDGANSLAMQVSADALTGTNQAITGAITAATTAARGENIDMINAVFKWLALSALGFAVVYYYRGAK